MKKKNRSAVILGRRGGITTRKRGKVFYSAIGKKGMKSRWAFEASKLPISA